MTILYIGVEGRLKQALEAAAASVREEVEVTVVDSGKLAVIQLLHNTFDYVIVDCSVKDIKCTSIVDFIQKDNLVDSQKIFVIAFRFSPKELKDFQGRGVHALTYTIDLKSLQDYFTNLFHSKALPFL
jgi:hypothetical protein